MSARRSFGRDDGGSARMRPAKPNLNAQVNHLIGRPKRTGCPRAVPLAVTTGGVPGCARPNPTSMPGLTISLNKPSDHGVRTGTSTLTARRRGGNFTISRVTVWPPARRRAQSHQARLGRAGRSRAGFGQLAGDQVIHLGQMILIVGEAFIDLGSG